MIVPKYSICMCNYNMAGTLEIALTSILDQLDDRFEVLIVDDGSTDASVSVIKKMQEHYINLRLVALERDSDRKLGMTRNKSVDAALGEYVLLHLDCDDVAAPHIIDFVNVFHQIENCLKKDVLLSGRPIQMGKREFLLKHGPYHNIHRGEDRDMWARFAAIDAYVSLDNKNLKIVLPKPFLNKVYRAFYYTFDHLRNDFRKGNSLGELLYFELFRQKNFSLQYKLIRLSVALPAWARAKFQGPLITKESLITTEEFSAYRLNSGGTFTEILQKNSCTPDWSQLSRDSRNYFMDGGR